MEIARIVSVRFQKLDYDFSFYYFVTLHFRVLIEMQCAVMLLPDRKIFIQYTNATLPVRSARHGTRCSLYSHRNVIPLFDRLSSFIGCRYPPQRVSVHPRHSSRRAGRKKSIAASIYYDTSPLRASDLARRRGIRLPRSARHAKWSSAEAPRRLMTIVN